MVYPLQVVRQRLFGAGAGYLALGVAGVEILQMRDRTVDGRKISDG